MDMWTLSAVCARADDQMSGRVWVSVCVGVIQNMRFHN